MAKEQIKSILCYGDSNTFGSDPDRPGLRHPYQVRWTGRLQALLGDGYHVVEEGMGGRNTVWDDPLEDGRNGLTYLPVALQSHKPLDLVILSLGTNDCKVHLHATPAISALGLRRLIEAVRRFDYGPEIAPPKLLVVSPIHMGPDIAHSRFEMMDDSSAAMARAMAPRYEALAREYGCAFLDAATVASPGSDQLHMDATGHKVLADALAPLVRSLV